MSVRNINKLAWSIVFALAISIVYMTAPVGHKLMNAVFFVLALIEMMLIVAGIDWIVKLASRFVSTTPATDDDAEDPISVKARRG